TPQTWRPVIWRFWCRAAIWSNKNTSKMKKSTIIGVDLGGTNMRAGRVTESHIAALESTQVPQTENWQVVMDELINTIQKVWTTETQGIGIGVPGIVDAATGVVYDLQN